MSRILVYQANSVQGAATLRHVQQAGFETRALIRNKSTATGLIARGVEVAVADFADRDALLRAHRSVDFAVVQIPAYADAFVATAIANATFAMKAARVEGAVIKMANPSSSQALPNSGFSANSIVLEMVRSCGIEHSVVEPTMYLDTFLKPNLSEEIARANVIDLPIEDTVEIAWTTVDDAARLAVSLLKSKTWGVTLRSAGETEYDGHGLAAAFSTVLGRKIAYRCSDLHSFERELKSAIAPAAAELVVRKFRFLHQLPHEARRLLGALSNQTGFPVGFRPTPVHDWIGANSASFQ
jgi:uncharacterized protein YbjT (DUF2867 family)